MGGRSCFLVGVLLLVLTGTDSAAAAPPAVRPLYDAAAFKAERERFFQGAFIHRCTPGGLPELERAVAGAPSSLDAHVALATCMSTQRPLEPGARGEALWFLQNYPDHPIVGDSLVMLLGFSVDREVLELWDKQLALHPDSAVLLVNASFFFRPSDPAKADDLLDRAIKLEPRDPVLAMQSAKRYYVRTFGKKGPERVAGAKLALEEFRRALSLGGQTEDVLGDAAKTAFVANDLAASETYAKQMLAAPNPDPYSTHIAEITLGKIALSRKNVNEAVGHLMAAGKVPANPMLATLGPDTTLATDLFAAGSRRVVLDYLRECKRLWTSHGDWVDAAIAQVQKGHAPAFRWSPPF
jgi:hypothetical protein